MDEIEKLFKIGEVMKYSRLSRQVINYYTQLGLIKEAKRTEAGHRLYDESVFKRLEKVKTLQNEGKALLEIKQILSGENAKGEGIA